MNKRGLSLVVTIAIIMILSVVALTLMFVVFKENFNIFQKQTRNYLNSTEAVSVRNACKLACEGESRIVYCCNKYDLFGEKVNCNDERLEVDCELSCEGFECSIPPIGPNGVGGT